MLIGSRNTLVRGQLGVLEPRLRYWRVLMSGALYGLLAVVAAGLSMLLIDEREARLTVLAVTGGISLIGSLVVLPLGSFYWLCCAGDVRRWRDWKTLEKTRSAVLAILAPQLVRLGAWAATLAGGALWLYGQVDQASYGSWVCCR
jgi:hypothetical protein